MTLIEFLIAILLISIVAAIAVPYFRSFIVNYRIAANAENLYSVLQYARTEAVKRNSNVYVSFVTGSNWCYGVNAGSACTCSSAGSCALNTTSADNAGVTSLSSTYSSNMYFEGTHGAASASGSFTFTLTSGSSLIQVNIGHLGNISECSTGISGYTAC
jgi:Tfp pilus assembly protein FimT